MFDTIIMLSPVAEKISPHGGGGGDDGVLMERNLGLLR